MTQPNILIFMVDQLNGTLFPDGPADWLHAPNLKALAARSTRFANAYTARRFARRACLVYVRPAAQSRRVSTTMQPNSRPPCHLCAPSAPRRVPDLPVGQDAFCRPGSVARVRRTPDHRYLPRRFWLDTGLPQPGERIDWWYHNMGSVTGAGVAEISNQMEYDDEVAYHATRQGL